MSTLTILSFVTEKKWKNGEIKKPTNEEVKKKLETEEDQEEKENESEEGDEEVEETEKNEEEEEGEDDENEEDDPREEDVGDEDEEGELKDYNGINFSKLWINLNEGETIS